jgi:hypothetical protein
LNTIEPDFVTTAMGKKVKAAPAAAATSAANDAELADLQPQADGPPTVVRRIFQPGNLMLLAFAAGIAVLAPWFVRQLPDLNSRPEYRLAFREIQLTPPPSGAVPNDILQQVQRQRDFADEVSILDPQLAKRIGQAVHQHPWIAAVREVRLSFPPQVIVEVEYRQPAALVSLQAGLYPIDVDGVLLPPADFTSADQQRYPLIRNVRSVPSGPAGVSWGDPTVLAAARLADVLRRDWSELQLTAIIAPRPATAEIDPAELRFELTAQGGSKIVWGRAPGSGHPGELTAEQKIGRLRKYLAEFGRYDQPRGPYEIDIRHWQEISRRPLDPRKIDAAFEERMPAR